MGLQWSAAEPGNAAEDSVSGGFGCWGDPEGTYPVVSKTDRLAPSQTPRDPSFLASPRLPGVESRDRPEGTCGCWDSRHDRGSDPDVTFLRELPRASQTPRGFAPASLRQVQSGVAGSRPVAASPMSPRALCMVCNDWSVAQVPHSATTRGLAREHTPLHPNSTLNPKLPHCLSGTSGLAGLDAPDSWLCNLSRCLSLLHLYIRVCDVVSRLAAARLLPHASVSAGGGALRTHLRVRHLRRNSVW